MAARIIVRVDGDLRHLVYEMRDNHGKKVRFQSTVEGPEAVPAELERLQKECENALGAVGT